MSRRTSKVCPVCSNTFLSWRAEPVHCSRACHGRTIAGKQPNGGFVAGQRAHNSSEIGDVRIRLGADGVHRAWVKIGHPTKWVQRYRHVWECANGPIPAGMLVHHKNRDPLDDRIENLCIMTNAEHLEEHRPERTNAGPAVAAAHASRRHEATCIQCNTPFIRLARRNMSDTCSVCRHRFYKARYKARMKANKRR